jgi:hypothetical protein
VRRSGSRIPESEDRVPDDLKARQIGLKAGVPDFGDMIPPPPRKNIDSEGSPRTPSGLNPTEIAPGLPLVALHFATLQNPIR